MNAQLLTVEVGSRGIPNLSGFKLSEMMLGMSRKDGIALMQQCMTKGHLLIVTVSFLHNIWRGIVSIQKVTHFRQKSCFLETCFPILSLHQLRGMLPLPH